MFSVFGGEKSGQPKSIFPNPGILPASFYWFDLSREFEKKENLNLSPVGLAYGKNNLLTEIVNKDSVSHSRAECN